MMNLYQIMANAQGGSAYDNIARQFGISPEQTQTAVQALLPAFSLGLNRASQSPDGLSALMQAMLPAAQTRGFENPAAAFGMDATSIGNSALQAMFGNRDTSRAIAGQAAMFSGIAEPILKQMLPVIASMILGGLFKSMTGSAQTQSAPAGLPDILGQIFGQMMGQPAPAPKPSNPMEDMMGSILGGMFGQQPAPQPAPSGLPGMPDLSQFDAQKLAQMQQDGASMFGQLFDSGLDASAAIQTQQVDALHEIFSSLLSRKDA